MTSCALTLRRWGEAGPLVVLLHGIGGGRDAWSDACGGAGAAIAAAGYRVVAYDLPGYGGSPRVEPFTLDAMAHAVAEAVLVEDARGAVVVGHSMGGMVAQSLAALAPTAVRALVLCGTSPAFGQPDGTWQQRFLQERLAPLDAGDGMAALAPKLVRAMVAPDAAPAAIEAAIALMVAVPEATYRAALTALVGFDRRDDLARLRVPVLCLAAEHDRNASPAVMQRMAERIARAELVCLPAAGHLMNIEAPDRFATAVVDFLRRHVPASASTAASSDAA